ncbi:MAG: helix-turn-helix transcriptional regulator [Actinobacteria bacterium]|nr:helix-turn-helix transcriptional regulator [Actinomycetota bacterium]
MLGKLRLRVLEALIVPGSATTVAAQLGESRQKINYHLRALESVGLVNLVEERPRRGVTERVVVASARSYVVSTEVLGPVATRPQDVDQLSSQYLIALGARTIREVSELVESAAQAGKSLATLSIDTEIRFPSAAARAEFAKEFADFVASMAAKYHDETTPAGRSHRVVITAYPAPKENN